MPFSLLAIFLVWALVLKYTTMRGIPVYYDIKLNSMKLHGDHSHCQKRREEKRREEKRREEKRREEKRREEKRREEKRREVHTHFFTMTVTKDLGCNGIPAVFSKESRNCVGNPLKKKRLQKVSRNENAKISSCNLESLSNVQCQRGMKTAALALVN